jgi:hypothetical protein
MACAEPVDIQLRSAVESHIQSISESAKRMVSMTTNALPAAELLRILPRSPVTKNAPRFAIHAVQLPIPDQSIE